MKKNDIIKMIKGLDKDYPILLLYIIGNFVNAILLRIWTTGHFHLRSIFFDLGLIFLLTAISFLVKKKNRHLFYIISTFLMVATCVANSLYYNYYKSFVSVSLLATSVFVKDVADAITDMVIRVCDFSYLWILVAMFIMFRRKPETENSNKKRFKKGFVITLIMFAIGSALPPYNAFSRLYKLWNRVSVADNFGPYFYQVDDIVQSLRPTLNNIFGYDRALKNTQDYYEKKKKVNIKNEYTNIFDGKNVIAIHAESLQNFTLNLSFNGKKVAPNISKLASEGIYFSNFYAQVGVGTSSDTEFTYATSLLPSSNGTVFVNYYNDKFVTMQKLLNDKGYYVFSMHGNDGDFWNRNIMHMNMGYDKFYSKSSFDIDEEYGLGLSDASFFRQVVPKIKKINKESTGPYYGTLITLTNHTPWRDAYLYSDYDVSMTTRVNGELVKRDYLENTLIGKYFKSVNYMDNVIGKFIEDMDNEGLLDNTIIVIYGDHDARISKSQFDYLYNYDPITDKIRDEDDSHYREFNDYDYELSKSVPFIIWSKDMDVNLKVDKPMGMIDVLPTLGNMLGVYSKYSLGKDIMATKSEDAIVVFKDGSFITDKIYYSAKNSESYTINSGIISDDYIQKRSDYADKIIEISNDIITYNLIDKMEED